MSIAEVKSDKEQQNSKSNDSSSSKIDTPPAADFETAMDVAGFGTFNYLLLLVALPSAMSSVYATSTMSYILPSAECDLKLTLLDKGILNAITYAGMITSAIIWGYVADTKGRKKLLVFGYLADCVSGIAVAMSQNVVQLMIFKYCSGFIVCGPFAVLMTYLTELYSRKYRARVMMTIGMMFTTATLTLPVLALTILPNESQYHMWGLTFHSWQIFLAVCTTPSLLSGLLMTLFPESPKFLMSQGRNAEALLIFRKIYALNQHKAKETYPITELINEIPEKESDIESDATVTIATIEGLKLSKAKNVEPKGFRKGFVQLRPLFVKPYLGLSLLVYLMNFAVLLGQNTVRLWLPQLFASIAEYEKVNDGATSMCAILEYSVNKTTAVKSDYPEEHECKVVITPASFTNNIIVALAGFTGYILCTFLVNRIGSKNILTCALSISGTCGIVLYFSSSSLSTLISSSLFVTMGSIASTSVISASVNLFPTSLRTMIISLAMMFGRCGSMIGNVLFPTFMSLGCIPPFVMISFVMFFASFLSIFVPNTNRTALK